MGNVPVESTVAGAALLYRLLETWPADRLRVLEMRNTPSNATRRLQDVQYGFSGSWRYRLQRTRFAWRANASLFNFSLNAGRKMLKIAGASDFKPDAILTVAHGPTWPAAADAARHLGVPLHLIVHDDFIAMTGLPSNMIPRVESVFADIYRGAASRLCVSPYMAEQYQKQFNVPGTVIYPCRAQGAAVFDSPPDRLSESGRPLTYAYAGSLSSADYVKSLVVLAQELGNRGNRLLIFSNLSADDGAKMGLAGQHVEIGPFIPFQDLIQQLRQRADVLFVPMSFQPGDRPNMELSFPSKLTDYTLIGLPLLIRGPAYCSAVKWARENPGSAVIVDDQSVESVAAGVEQFVDPVRRVELAKNAMRVGQTYFSHETVSSKFIAAMSEGLPGAIAKS
jgi:hypothetical protein